MHVEDALGIDAVAQRQADVDRAPFARDERLAVAPGLIGQRRRADGVETEPQETRRQQVPAGVDAAGRDQPEGGINDCGGAGVVETPDPDGQPDGESE
jgi:hypothetical protein